MENDLALDRTRIAEFPLLMTKGFEGRAVHFLSLAGQVYHCTNGVIRTGGCVTPFDATAKCAVKFCHYANTTGYPCPRRSVRKSYCKKSRQRTVCSREGPQAKRWIGRQSYYQKKAKSQVTSNATAPSHYWRSKP